MTIESLNQTESNSPFQQTVNFHATEPKISEGSGMRVVKVSSKETKDEQGNTIPKKFQPFFFVLPSSYCEPINKLPEAIRPVVFKSLDELLRPLASERKVSGLESLILQPDAFREFQKESEQKRLTLEKIAAWTLEKLAPLLKSKLEKIGKSLALPAVLKSYSELYQGLHPNSKKSISDANLEKMAGNLMELDLETDPIGSQLLELLEKRMKAPEEMDLLV